MLVCDDVSLSSPNAKLAFAGDDASDGGKSRLCVEDTGTAAPDTVSPDAKYSLLGKDVPKLVADDKPTSPTPKADADEPAVQAPSSSWLVDGRRLKGRDTRISSILRPLVGGGPAFADIVVSIFPLPVSAKRGGACFKAANGIGRIQLKCNNPIDLDLSVCITVGSTATRCQRHNFVSNPLMTFLGDWDFKAFINPNVDRPTVPLNLQLLLTDEVVDPGADTCTTSSMIPPAIADPAIAAFSVSTMAIPEPAGEIAFGDFPAPKVKEHIIDSTKDAVTGPSPSSPQQTPEATPRKTPQQTPQPAWQPTTPQAPPPSPFFKFGDSLLFTFTLRLADGIQLGLEINRDEHNQELVVKKVIPGGAAEAWNRQCFAGPFSSKAVVPTDRIVGINGRSDITGMMEECRLVQLLKIFVVRGDLPHVDIPLSWCGAPTPSPTIQLVGVPVPIYFPVTCGKHGIVEGAGVPMATGPDQFGGDAVAFRTEVLTLGSLRACAPEFFPPGTGQEGTNAEATGANNETCE